MKKIITLLLTAALVFSLCACGAGSTAAQIPEAESGTQSLPADSTPDSGNSNPETREFTDDCGRTVTVPYNVTKVAVSGPLSQIYILPLCPEMMVGFASEFSSNAKDYIKSEYLALPTLGQLYGGKGDMNREELLAADPDVVIDVGEQKGSIAEDLDKLSEQTGIPFVHIDATVETAPEAYMRLGELTGKTEKAQELANYLASRFDMVKEVMERVDADGARKSMVYCLGPKGLNVLAEKSYHAETINFVADNAAKIEDVVSHGDGNEIDEELMVWNPDVIVFAPESVYSQVASEPRWQMLDAVKSGQYYETPTGPYGWLQSPPAVQRYLGMMWLAYILYPDYCGYDLQEEVTQYYKLFYDYDLTADGYAALTANSMGNH